MLKVKTNNKTHFVILRVTEKEKDYLVKTSDKQNKSVSKFVRFMLGFE